MVYTRGLWKRGISFFKCAAMVAASVLTASDCSGQAAAENKTQHSAGPDEWNSKYPGLLTEFGQLFVKLQKNVEFPAARGQSHILPLLPESTIAYGAIPNYGETSNQTLKIFRQELQENETLRNWWQHGDMAASGPKIEDALAKFYRVNQYLGDEIVVSAVLEGKEPRMLMVAEIKKPGLKTVLEQMEKELSGKSKSQVKILDPQELTNLESTRPTEELLLLVRPDYVVGATDLQTLRNFNERLDRGLRGFAGTRFGQRVAQAYEDGITLMAAADVHKMLDQAPIHSKNDQASFQRSGFADMKYAVWEHTSVSGHEMSKSELSFSGPRQGAAAWLGKPIPLASLDFVSPKAIMAATFVLTSPAQIFEDVKAIETISNPAAFATLTQAEQGLKMTLKDDLLSYLGGEITLEVDTIAPPKAEWRAILKVTDAKRLQQTLGMLLTAGHFAEPPFEENGVMYYPVKIPSGQTAIEISYAYMDGYVIFGSSHESVVESIRVHTSGESLGKSKKFLESIPPNQSASASGMLYQDPVALTALRMQAVAPGIAHYFQQVAGDSAPGVMYIYGEDAAIREASRGGSLDVAAILVGAAIAIPNLLRSRTAANEASAVGSVRTVITSQVAYASMFSKNGFATSIASLGPDPSGRDSRSAEHAGLIDETLGNSSCAGDMWCKKSGYNFRVTSDCKAKPCQEYVVMATPANSNTGNRSFCSTSDGVIRYKFGAPLTASIDAAECKTWQPLN